MIVVAWWDEPLHHLRGGERLAGLDVFFDFRWEDVFGHGRATFPGGQSLARLIRTECSPDMIPTLLLTNRAEANDEPLETPDSRWVVIVRIQDYLQEATPDPARSYYGVRIGPRLAAAKELRALATRADVIRAVVEFGLTIDDIEFWASLGEGRHQELDTLPRPDGGVAATADLRQVVDALRGIEGLDPEIVDALKDFLRNNPDLLAMFLRSDVDAPDIVALAHRRDVLVRFESLLYDDADFDAAQESVGGSAEKVWQDFIEANPWVIGSAIAPQFLHSWSKHRLEQTVKGFSIAGPGKRADAVFRTAGALSAVVLAEIKHHRTNLVAAEYRPACWRVSSEVAGGVAQCQGTADEAERLLGPTVDVTTDDGHVEGRAFVCRPRTVLVVGSLTEFLDDGGNAHHEKFESFERFRRGLRDPEILTFDELFARARLALALQDVEVSPVDTAATR